MPGWNADWSVRPTEIVNNPSDKLLQCSEWIEHPVLVVQRDTFANFFHDSEDFVNSFLALAILEWNLGDTQLYLTDLFPKGPFWYVKYGVGCDIKYNCLYCLCVCMQGHLGESVWQGTGGQQSARL